MRPAIQDGDRLVLVGDTQSVQLGDVVVLPDRPFAVCHRVIARIGERVWVKGDAVGVMDGSYVRDALTGRVVAVERGALHQPARRIGAVVGSVLSAGPRRVRNRS